MKSSTSRVRDLASNEKLIRDSFGREPAMLSDIYLDEINLAVWQRTLSSSLTEAVVRVSDINPNLEISLITTPEDVYSSVMKALGSNAEATSLCDDVANLVDMFCCLFDLKQAGLRLAMLDCAMCPRFHVDKVPCRLVTTYHGVGTEWLPHLAADRSKLGVGNQGKSDDESGLFNSVTNIEQLMKGDVALLKGEAWKGNQGAGVIHRSPQLATQGRRLLLTLDIDDS